MGKPERDYREGDWVRYTVDPCERTARIVAVNDREWDLATRDYRPPKYTVETPDGERAVISRKEIVCVADDIVGVIAGLAAMKLSMRFRYRLAGEHVHVTLFTAGREGTLANSGKLVFRETEWTALTMAMRVLASVTPNVDVDFVEGEPE